MTLTLGLRFASERFDYQSTLPDTFNAGNRFYGRDVAAYLTGELQGRGITASFFDEDWGWLVNGRLAGDQRFEIAVYNLAEHGEGGRAGVNAWGLWVRAFGTKKVLGFLSRTTAVAVPAELAAAIEAAVRAAGAEPEAWADGPEG